jgi:hypothetical protein
MLRVDPCGIGVLVLPEKRSILAHTDLSRWAEKNEVQTRDKEKLAV